MDAAAIARTPLYFETRNGKRFPNALVHATVAGKPTSMIVDSGSTDIVLGRSIVQRLGLKVSTAKADGVDAAGHALLAHEVAAPDIMIDGWRRAAYVRVLATPLPGEFDALGIGGVLSPQRLAGTGESIIIDFGLRRLLLVANGNVEAYLAHTAGSDLSPITCLDTYGVCLYIVDAQVDGHPARLILDTGATYTSIVSGSPVGRELAPISKPARGALFVASGKATARILPHAKLSVGGSAHTLEVLVVPGPPVIHDDLDGRLGMNFLRHCVIVLNDVGGTLACRRK